MIFICYVGLKRLTDLKGHMTVMKVRAETREEAISKVRTYAADRGLFINVNPEVFPKSELGQQHTSKWRLNNA